MSFTLAATDKQSKARAGTLQLPHGEVQTPIFMPVGTLGTVKGIRQNELKEQADARIILGNTYHLYLRPGIEILKAAGGLHRFIGWDRPMLTDSGGYQVFSLSDRRKISEEGVWFQSHIDGSRHQFTPENVMDIQRAIGADIIMAFDECPPWPCDEKYATDSMHLTHRWLKRCIAQFNETDGLYGYPQILAPICQGGTYPHLRVQSAKFISECDMPLNAIGGLSVGEPADLMYEMTDIVTNVLPADKPRYLMGVGTPVNLLECIALGIDMFDCVIATRNARHGIVYTENGIINLRNLKWANDFSPLCERITPQYSKAYLRHLVMMKELLAAMVASLHNISFFLWLMREARAHIIAGDFTPWKEEMVKKLDQRL